MGSARFPGKMMADFLGTPLLAWVLKRVSRAATLSRVVLATSDLGRDDALAELARSLGVAVWRGSEDDVLGRFAQAARAFPAEAVVRVCADNPLIAPEAIDLLVESFDRVRPDYAFNHVPRMDNGWPDGLGAEMLTSDLLLRLADTCAEPSHREHATKAIWDGAGRYRILPVACPPAWADNGDNIRLDIDLPEHLEQMARLGFTPDDGIETILHRWRNGGRP